MANRIICRHETTANALIWACYLLAVNQDVQDDLRNEIYNIIPPLESEVSTAALDTAPLLHGVINETLHLFPGAPILLRESICLTTVQGQHVPRSTQVILCPWAVNRSPELWGEDAGKFKPQRWNDGGDSDEPKRPNNNGGQHSPYAMLTFLQGPRRCIGENFYRSEPRCLMAALVGSFRLEMADPAAEVVPSGIIGLKARDGMNIRLTALDSWREK